MRKLYVIVDGKRIPVDVENLNWQKVRKKPVEVEAVPVPGVVVVETLEGEMAAEDAWVIRGVRGEIYPCERSIFEETYEVARAGEPDSVRCCNCGEWVDSASGWEQDRKGRDWCHDCRLTLMSAAIITGVGDDSEKDDVPLMEAIGIVAEGDPGMLKRERAKATPTEDELADQEAQLSEYVGGV